MKHKDYLEIVPKLHFGNEIEAESFVDFENDKEANFFYDIAKSRLLNVNEWHNIAGVISAKFQVYNNDGEKSENNIQQGYFIRVDIPGPGSAEGDGYDWVHVEELKEINEGNVQSIGFRVRPHSNPLGDKDETAHFYSEESTSCFIITREDEKVSAVIIDRDIKPNDKAGSIADKIRNSAVGAIAISAFSKLQWQNLVKGLMAGKK